MSLAWDLNLHLRTTEFMHRIACPNGDFGNAVGDANTRQRARKRLLVFMRVIEHARFQHPVVERNHIPLIGIVIPSLVAVLEGDREGTAARALDLDVDYTNFPGNKRRR